MVRGKYRSMISRGKEATTHAFSRHFEDIIHRYGTQYVVNLLSPAKEGEKAISDGYEEQLQLCTQQAKMEIKYVAFDFHAQLGKSGLKFNMIGPLLLDTLQDDLTRFGLYIRDLSNNNNNSNSPSLNNSNNSLSNSNSSNGGLRDSSNSNNGANNAGTVLSEQKGTFRINCLDCLDRYVVACFVCSAYSARFVSFPFVSFRFVSFVPKTALVCCAFFSLRYRIIF